MHNLTKCALCARNGESRLAVEVLDEMPVCGPCLITMRQFRLVAELDADAPAKTRRPGLPVPAMTRGHLTRADGDPGQMLAARVSADEPAKVRFV